LNDHPQYADSAALLASGRRVLEIERDAVAGLLPRVDDAFAQACAAMLGCGGRVVVTGMGKSGHIGNKIAATLASTGTPSFFVHPGEASHGDLGMITRQDVVLAISNSGETVEILTILPLIKRMGAPLIAMTGRPGSTLASSAEVQLAYAIGVAQPVSVTVSTENTAVIPEDQIAELVKQHFSMTPRGIIKHLNLLRPIYKTTARHGHFGRTPGADGSFSWEKTDKAAALAKAAGIKMK